MTAILPIFAVEGHTGEYSDRSEWIVAAFASRERADAFLLECENFAIDNHLFRHDNHRGRQNKRAEERMPGARAEPAALRAVLAWLKTQPHTTFTRFDGGPVVLDARGTTRDLGWTEIYDWKNALREAIAAGAVVPPDRLCADADYGGIDYVVVELRMSFTTRGDVEDFCDALIAIRQRLPEFTPTPETK